MDTNRWQFASPQEKYDVAIVGAHLAPSLLGAILAKHGLRVLMVDAEPDVTEPAGETTVPYTAEVFFTLARRFGMPEIAGFGLTSDLPREIRRASGGKRSLSFLYHAPGRGQDPRQALQFNVPGEHSEWHPHRPGADQYARRIARSYGVRAIRLRPKVVDVIPAAGCVTVVTADGAAYRARFVIDAMGMESPLLRRLGGPDPVAALRTRSRVLHTHMSGVLPFEDCVRQEAYSRATPWSNGTISHVFPGGWIQVAHFDNHPEAGSSICSVTVSVDPEAYGGLPKDPEGAFGGILERLPDVRRSFADAVAVRPWTSDDQWQRSVTRPVGDRYLLFERSASRNDLFLSRDVTMSAELVHAVAPVVLAAARADDWSAGHFAGAAAFQAALINFNDRMLATAQMATRDFRLWNAFCRVWLLWSMLAALSLKSTRNRCLLSGDWTPIEGSGPYWFALPSGLPELLEQMFSLGDGIRAGEVLPGAAAGQIFAALRRAPFTPPLYGFADPEDRYYHFTLVKRLRMLAWAKTAAPPEFRAMLTKENLTSVPPPAVH